MTIAVKKDGRPLLKKELIMQQSKDRLQRDLRRSTRQKLDPFLQNTHDSNKKSHENPGFGLYLKRKRVQAEDESGKVDAQVEQVEIQDETQIKTPDLGLVGYGSDSDS